MRKLLKFEFFKLTTSKLFKNTCIIFVLANIALLLYTSHQSNEIAIPYLAYKRLNSELENVTKEQKQEIINTEYEKYYAIHIIMQIKNLRNNEDELFRAYAEDLKVENLELYDKYLKVYERGVSFPYTGTIDKEFEFWQEIKNEYDEISNYDQFINAIIEKANNLSTIAIFNDSKNNFSNRNIKDTANKYEDMKDIKIDYQVSKGIDMFTNSSGTDLFIILFVFVVSSIILLEERGKNLFVLIKSTKNGRLKTIVSKIVVLVIVIMLFSLLLYSVNFIYYGCNIGYGDVGASIQSLHSFLYSVLKIKVWQYVLLFLVTKMMAYFIIGLLILLISTFAKNSITTYLTFALLFFVSFIMYSKIEIHSSLNPLRYLNVISLLMPNAIYNNYINLNIFGMMLNVINSSIIFSLLLLMSLLIGSIIIFIKKRDLQIKESKILNKLKSISVKPKITSNIFIVEMHKLFIINKVVILIILFVIFQINNFNHANQTISFNETIYKNYMEILKGELTEDKETYLKDEITRFDQAEISISNIEDMYLTGKIDRQTADKMKEQHEEVLSIKPIFMKVLDNYEYIKANKGTDLVYETGYYQLFGLSRDNAVINSMYLIIVSLLCFTTIFVMEYTSGVIQILNTTPRGRAYTARSKICACFIAGTLLYISSIIPDIVTISEVYGFNNLYSSITSLQAFHNLPLGLNILGYICIMYLMKYLVFIGIILFILMVTLKLKNTTYSILMLSVVLLIPLVLSFTGLKVARVISIVPSLNITEIIQAGYGLYVFYIVIPIVIGIYSYHELCIDFE